MQSERSCVHPFIEQTQKAFQEGGSLSNVLGTIKDYQSRFNALVTNISPEAKIPHAIGMSALGLGAIVVYEYARAHGVALPDSRGVVTTLVPVASITPQQSQEFKSPELREAERKFNEGMLHSVDLHREMAYGDIDRKLESGEISPKQAQQQKDTWDDRHGVTDFRRKHGL